MPDIIRETVTTQSVEADQALPAQTQEQPIASSFQSSEYIIYFLFGALEIFLALRLVLKLTGANSVSDFVSFIYSITGIFILPFEGIFRSGTAQGAETTAVFEPATLVAILVYSLVAWGMVNLVRLLSGRRQVE